MLISDLVNVRYLSGFTGSNAALLIRVDGKDAETPVLATDGRYRTQAARQAPDAEIVIHTGEASDLGRHDGGPAMDYRLNEEAPQRDWLALILGVLAVAALLGLIPLWYFVFLAYQG